MLYNASSFFIKTGSSLKTTSALLYYRKLSDSFLPISTHYFYNKRNDSIRNHHMTSISGSLQSHKKIGVLKATILFKLTATSTHTAINAQQSVLILPSLLCIKLRVYYFRLFRHLSNFYSII